MRLNLAIVWLPMANGQFSSEACAGKKASIKSELCTEKEKKQEQVKKLERSKHGHSRMLIPDPPPAGDAKQPAECSPLTPTSGKR